MAYHRGDVTAPSARHTPATQWSSVLVVDDEPPVREFLTRWLTGWGYNVKTAGSASEALEVMEAEPFPIMMCDIKMPGHDGLWLAEQVRARWPKTAIIIATGAHAHDLKAVQASRKLGAVDYIMKPFEREMLRQALRRAANALEANTRHGEDPNTTALPDPRSPQALAPDLAICHVPTKASTRSEHPIARGIVLEQVDILRRVSRLIRQLARACRHSLQRRPS